MIAFRINELKAALHCAAVKDYRSYLNGILIDVRPTQVYIVSMDGHRMFVGKSSAERGDNLAPFTIIVPAAVVKTAIKSAGKFGIVALKHLSEATYSLGDCLFQPLDGRYPDWQRVIPSDLSGTLGTYNADYLADAQAALRDWKESRILIPTVQHNGTSAGLIAVDTAFCVVMPIRDGDKCPAFTVEDNPVAVAA